MKLNVHQNRKKTFKNLLTTFLFMFLAISLSFANECEQLVITTTDSSIKIENIEAPKAIIKVFDADWNRVAKCEDEDCGTEINFVDLGLGEYHVQAQLFNADWEGICETTIDVNLEGCFCPQVFMPVCGVDGKTYGNSCEAACAGVEVVAEGECAPVTTCDLLARITLPTNLCDQGLTEIAVYELNGKSYLVYLADNVLIADAQSTVFDCDTGEEFCLIGGLLGETCDGFLDKAEKIQTIVQETCGGCLCPEIYAPVCGDDGKTYGNQCEADCAGVKVVAEGECKPCNCDDNYAPVCGIDGKTYPNRCQADCAGVDIIAEGECAPITTCDLLSRITFNTDLCSQCLSEIAVYRYNDKSYLVYLGDNIICADVPNRVVDCDTGEPFCNDGGGELPNTCGDFFEVAEKIETVLKDACTPCLCPAVYEPVCGVDGKTYGNRCEADCAGVDIIEEGECAPVTTCDLLSRITFSTDLCSQCLTEIAVYELDGKSYLVYLGDNEQCADAATTVVDCETGEELCIIGGFGGFTCDGFLDKAEKLETVLADDCTPCICTLEYAPVCGVDGKTYGNRCEADCAGVDIVAEGECPCLCPAVALPVCGVDGKTYINACKAACAGIEVAFDGTCEECLGEPKDDPFCTKEYEPVCGCNGVTYGNVCEAEAAGVKSWTEGICPDPEECLGPPNPLIKCDSEYIPVCGCDGNTYQNACTASQNGVLRFTEGACPPDPCVCPDNYDPVCGKDGKTYGNECEAICAGVEIAYEGECETNEECDILALIDFSDDLCGSCITEIAVYSYRGKNYLVQLGDFVNCPDAVNTVISCAIDGEVFCEDGYEHTGKPCGDFFEIAVKVRTILKDDCEDDCQGLPTPGVPCEEIYEPVCACDGKTYDNQCVAQSLGLKSWTEGACPLTTIECGEISIAYDAQRIIMKGKEEASYFFKVHDRNNNYHEIFNCVNDCGSEQTTFLPFGDYVVKIYDRNWNLVCEQAVILQEPSVSEPADEEDTDSNNQFRCDEVVVTYQEGTVKLIGNSQKNYHLKVIDKNYRDAFACMWECGSTITAKNIPTGAYLVRVFDGDYNVLCEKSILMNNTRSTIRTTNNLQITAYPNPAKEAFFMKIKSNQAGTGTLLIINAYGQVITTQKIDNQFDETIRVDVSDYQNGLYYYQIKLPKQQLIGGKFLVNRLY